MFVYILPTQRSSNVKGSNKSKIISHYHRWYPEETMINEDYTDNLALQANIPTQAESQLIIL